MRSKVTVLLGVVFLLAGTAACEDPDLAKLRQKLSEEKDPADRAKITVKIGEQLLKQASDKYLEGAYQEGNELLEEYLAAVRAAHEDLEQSGLDARRKPKGFKHLEIHLRKSRRTIEDWMRRIPYSRRPPLEEKRNEVEEIRAALLSALMKAGR